MDKDTEVNTGKLYSWGGMDQRGLVDHPAVGTVFFIAIGLCFSAWPCVGFGLQQRAGIEP